MRTLPHVVAFLFSKALASFMETPKGPTSLTPNEQDQAPRMLADGSDRTSLAPHEPERKLGGKSWPKNFRKFFSNLGNCSSTKNASPEDERGVEPLGQKLQGLSLDEEDTSASDTVEPLGQRLNGLSLDEEDDPSAPHTGSKIVFTPASTDMHFQLINMPAVDPMPQCPGDEFLCVKEYYYTPDAELKSVWTRVQFVHDWKALIRQVASTLPGHETSLSYVLGETLAKGHYAEVRAVANRNDLVVRKMNRKLDKDEPEAQIQDITGVVAMYELAKRPGYDNAHVHASMRDLYLKGGALHMVMDRCSSDLFDWIDKFIPRLAKNAFLEAKEKEDKDTKKKEWMRVLREIENELIDHVRGILLAVAFMHKNDFVHRDIKPENVLVCSGVAKLTDFDFTTRYTPGVKQTFLKGTEGYFSPQFGEGKPYDGKKHDMFAVGATIDKIVVELRRAVRGANPGQSPSRRAQFKFLGDLVKELKQHDEAERPSAEDAVDFMETEMKRLGIEIVGAGP